MGRRNGGRCFAAVPGAEGAPPSGYHLPSPHGWSGSRHADWFRSVGGGIWQAHECGEHHDEEQHGSAPRRPHLLRLRLRDRLRVPHGVDRNFRLRLCVLVPAVHLRYDGGDHRQRSARGARLLLSLLGAEYHGDRRDLPSGSTVVLGRRLAAGTGLRGLRGLGRRAPRRGGQRPRLHEHLRPAHR